LAAIFCWRHGFVVRYTQKQEELSPTSAVFVTV